MLPLLPFSVFAIPQLPLSLGGFFLLTSITNFSLSHITLSKITITVDSLLVLRSLRHGLS
jgi:hypothetical protein